MSYPGVDLDETETTKPAETQVVSSGENKLDDTPPLSKEQIAERKRKKLARQNRSRENEKPAVTPEFEAAVADAVKNQFAVTDEWKPAKVVKFLVECPGSGQKVLLKHLDPMALLNYDLIEEIDFFSRKLFSPSGNDADSVAESIWASFRDPEKRLRFLSMTGRLMAVASVKPKIVFDGVALVNEKDEDGNETGEVLAVFGHQVEGAKEQLELFGKLVPPLKEGQAYAGAIGFGDRMAIFQALNQPLSVIEPFRERPDAIVESVESGQGSEHSAEPAL